MHIRMTQVREETAIADKTRSIEQLLNYFQKTVDKEGAVVYNNCLLYTSPSPRDRTRSRMPSSA